MFIPIRTRRIGIRISMMILRLRSAGRTLTGLIMRSCWPITRQSFAMRRPLLRSFGVGLVHGLAGSAAIALLVFSAIPQPLWATLYLAIFCFGTIVGMGLITTAIATPLIVAVAPLVLAASGLRDRLRSPEFWLRAVSCLSNWGH